MSDPEVTPAEQAEAFLAWRRGEAVEFWNAKEKKWWPVFTTTEGLYKMYTYRRKPQPKVKEWRTWKCEEVPVGALVRTNWTDKDYIWIIATLRKGKVFGGFYEEGVDLFALLSYFEHSTDGGKTWGKCGVLE